MTVFISIIHLVGCIVLILVILLQTGKGADLGAMLGGGGANTLFGGGGSGGFLSKMTSGVAVLFLVTCLTLAYLSAHETSVTQDGAVPANVTGDVPEVTPDPTTGVQQPADEQPAGEQPAADQPAADQPAADQPATEEPAPAAEAPAAAAPAAEAQPEAAAPVAPAAAEGGAQ
ncbi:MAG TPA: preprotein translocase subunit SecG [bacterium]|nr:preprotein translocase subunit SecG [bacterium]